MSNVYFISDAYTVDGLKLPMVHFESKEKRYMCYMYSWYVRYDNRQLIYYSMRQNVIKK